jgi:hypothetical protein
VDTDVVDLLKDDLVVRKRSSSRTANLRDVVVESACRAIEEAYDESYAKSSVPAALHA